MADELKDIVLKYVIAEYSEDGADPIEYDTPLISGGIVDSFSMVSLKRFLENKYKISSPDDQARVMRQQHRQTIGHHDGADHAGVGRHTSIKGRAA